MDCILESCGEPANGVYAYRCGLCNRPWESQLADPKEIHRPCVEEFVPDGETPEQRAAKPKRTMRLAWSAAVAHAKWVKAGMPIRTPEEIEATFALCQACKFFEPNTSEPDKGHCGVCGCGLKKAGGIGAKNMMATEHCPLTPPKW